MSLLKSFRQDAAYRAPHRAMLERLGPCQHQLTAERPHMPTLKTKDGETRVSVNHVARMADRTFRLGGEGRRRNYVEKARKRIEAGQIRKNDVAIVISAGLPRG